METDVEQRHAQQGDGRVQGHGGDVIATQTVQPVIFKDQQIRFAGVECQHARKRLQVDDIVAIGRIECLLSTVEDRILGGRRGVGCAQGGENVAGEKNQAEQHQQNQNNYEDD